MKIFITSRGRADRQVTLRGLSPELLARTFLVVPHGEHEAYRARIPEPTPILERPENVTDLSLCRQWILDRLVVPRDRFVLLDDDVRFLTRTDELVQNVKPWYRLRNSTPEQVTAMFAWLEGALEYTAHAAVSFRASNRGTTETLRSPGGRQYMLLAYRAAVLKGNDCRFDRLPLMSDFDMTLQLLRLGHPNPMTFTYAIEQDGTNRRGGCSTYRTKALMSEAARGLAALHPEFVRLRDKKPKSFKVDDGGTYQDVRVRWREAYRRS